MEILNSGNFQIVEKIFGPNFKKSSKFNLQIVEWKISLKGTIGFFAFGFNIIFNFVSDFCNLVPQCLRSERTWQLKKKRSWSMRTMRANRLMLSCPVLEFPSPKSKKFSRGERSFWSFQVWNLQNSQGAKDHFRVAKSEI